MAAPQRYPTPHSQLRELAEMAQLEGVPFEDFWARAMRPGLPAVTWKVAAEDRPAGCVVWPRDTFDRSTSRGALIATKDGWRRAYEGVPPTPEEQSLSGLIGLLDRLEVEAAAEPAPVLVAA